MADVTIGALSPAGQALLTNLFEIEESSSSFNLSLQQVVDLLNTGLVPGVNEVYTNIAARDLDQPNLLNNVIVEVTDAVDDPEVNTSTIAWYRHNSGTFSLISYVGIGGGGITTFEKDFVVNADLDNVIEDYRVTTPVSLSVKLYNGVSNLSYRTKLDDGVDTFTDRADLSALNTYLSGLSNGTDVVIEVTTDATKLTVVRFIEDRS